MKLPDNVYRLSAAFKAAGFELYVVGGAVRDAVLGIEPKDIDLATNALPDQVAQIIVGMTGMAGLDEVGKSFGVVRARLNDIIDELDALSEYEIATFRTDIGAGRRPEAVQFTTIENDVMRRDLTINALFYDIQSGEVVDLVGGLHDLELGIINTVGDPKQRFAEDRLRVMRVIRFAARFGWPIGEATAAAIHEDNNLNGVSAERIRDEFVRGLASAKDESYFYDIIDEFGLWRRIFPGIESIRRDMPEGKNLPVVMALLFGGNEPEALAKRLNVLKYSSVEIAQVTFLLRLSDLSIETAHRLRKAYANSYLTNEDIREYVRLTSHHKMHLIEPFLEYRPTVNGNDLLAEGYSGKAVGVELERRETELFKRLVEGHA